MGANVVTLREITAKTVRAICALETKNDQKRLVAPNAVSIAQAHFEPSARFRAVYADSTPVGFIMWRAGVQEDVCFLWRLMIDGRHQCNGYGRAALALLIESLRADGCGRIQTSYVPDETGPKQFYIALGFKEMGESLGNGERLAEMSL